jgi:hypothetical protein
VAAIASIATRRLSIVQRVMVTTSCGLIVGVTMLITDPIYLLAEGPHPAIAIVLPDVNARAMISPNLDSPFAIRIGGRLIAVSATGVAIGIGPIPVEDMVTYRSVVANGEPTRLPVRMHRGRTTNVEITYEGKACKPLEIDPAIKTIWKFQFVDCPRSPSPPSR